MVQFQVQSTISTWAGILLGLFNGVSCEVVESESFDLLTIFLKYFKDWIYFLLRTYKNHVQSGHNRKTCNCLLRASRNKSKVDTTQELAESKAIACWPSFLKWWNEGFLFMFYPSICDNWHPCPNQGKHLPVASAPSPLRRLPLGFGASRFSGDSWHHADYREKMLDGFFAPIICAK